MPVSETGSWPPLPREVGSEAVDSRTHPERRSRHGQVKRVAGETQQRNQRVKGSEEKNALSPKGNRSLQTQKEKLLQNPCDQFSETAFSGLPFIPGTFRMLLSGPQYHLLQLTFSFYPTRSSSPPLFITAIFTEWPL